MMSLMVAATLLLAGACADDADGGPGSGPATTVADTTDRTPMSINLPPPTNTTPDRQLDEFQPPAPITHRALDDLLGEWVDTGDVGYGLGLSGYTIGGRTVYGHDGRTIGFASSLRHDPTTGVTLVVLANAGTAATDDLATELLVRTHNSDV